MLNRLLRETWTKVMTPIATLFLRLGISPDVVTIVGTVGVCVGALAFFPRGQLLVGTLVVTLFIFSDNVDGVMARMSGRQGPWGAYLDSTLDRVGDAAIFGGLVLYFAGTHENVLGAGFALACLILGFVVSYSKARAEGLGMTANVGIAERADRLLAALVATFLVGVGVSVVLLVVVLGLLSVASLVTIVQRMVAVRRQALARSPHGTPDQHSPGVSTP
jgi:CDP-diacylglycerol--glycerol-3-phosphate 3-phosphatidyltransferase